MAAIKKLLISVCVSSSLSFPLPAKGQEGVFLTEDEAPKAVFPGATRFDRKPVPSSPELREKIRQRMGKTKTSFWEESYLTFTAKKGDHVLGFAVIVEEIGKHRPITFIVGVGRDGKVRDIAVMVYREPYGGQVRDRRFLAQYEGTDLKGPLLPHRDIVNIAGATLSVEAIGRGAKKAMAIVEIIFLEDRK